MSYEKLGKRSYLEKKSDAHLDSWKEEMKGSVGRSSKELGIYNRQEVLERIKSLYDTLPKMKEFEFLKSLRNISEDIGVYVVGGSVRDAVLEKSAKDIDLVVNRIEPIELINVLLKFGKVVFDRNPKAQLDTMDKEEISRLVKDNYGVIKFDPEDSTLLDQIDISFPREDNYSGSGQAGILGIKRDVDSSADPNLSISECLRRRDLTFNAMAVNLMDGEIVDPFDGIDDIVRGKIRTVGRPEDRILKEDLSRGFRAIRFACVLSAELDDRVKKVIKEIFQPASHPSEAIYWDRPDILIQVREYEKEVRSQFKIPSGPLPKCLRVFWDREQRKPRTAVANEVMSKEILKAMDADPKKFIELMDEVVGLEIILPEVAHLQNLAQPREFHREGDAKRHTMMLLDNLPADASLRLKLAALLHDVGKVETQKISEDGKITFYGHEKISADHVRSIGKRFRLPNQLIDNVAWLVENHMFHITSDIERVKSTKIERMFLEDEGLGKDLVNLSRADTLSSLPERGEPNLTSINQLLDRIDKIKKLRDKKKDEIPRLITGKDLIKLGFQPGPEFSDILDHIREAQLNGEIETKEEGIELAKKYNNLE